MEKPKHKFTHSLFNLSTDYKLLWELIQKGNKIPAWLVYNEMYDDIIWDIVEVGKPRARCTTEQNDYYIGTRGRGFGAEKTFEGFVLVCKTWSLHFVLPEKLK